ncbi:hypothetical protein GNX71_28450 [Variovorax sp. RKNM96]|uniref:hypothetical protein n=1 Tax=Variovorax sp. RKNM96 TaxID=2681552 RepID=UPI00197E88F8|nr:hypothetical protein [Variovorax sp. RKNM96]QSI33286.1 hypothetical protein GNX71_28450 [Variovorax sp. RKNM96]
MNARFFASIAALAFGLPPDVSAQPSQCRVHASGSFGGSSLKLVSDHSNSASPRFVVFKAPMAVNTDGAPTSYHPQDFLGKERAINRLDNGIAIRTLVGARPDVATQAMVVRDWQKAKWMVPSGYRITWQNVIASRADGKPCVFVEGENAGFFGSLTSLKNGLPANEAGECGVNNQVDQRFIPTIALRGGASNPMTGWGAKVGDLVLAVNPQTGASVAGVIGDSGNGNRIGEGSVAMNMALSGKTIQPRNYAETLSLDLSTSISVAVLPKSILYKRERPYTAQNLTARVQNWATENFGSLDAFKTLLTNCI